ncbi:hypothetical protein [Peribacillus frigoritolerans]|nr:hypothetical protein [Peribacillus frigoritolerans]
MKIPRLKDIKNDVTVVNQKEAVLKNGQTVYTSTIKRDEPIKVGK